MGHYAVSVFKYWITSVDSYNQWCLPSVFLIFRHGTLIFPPPVKSCCRWCSSCCASRSSILSDCRLISRRTFMQKGQVLNWYKAISRVVWLRRFCFSAGCIMPLGVVILSINSIIGPIIRRSVRKKILMTHFIMCETSIFYEYYTRSSTAEGSLSRCFIGWIIELTATV